MTATQPNSLGPGPSPLSLWACGVSTEGAGLYFTARSACGNSAHLTRKGRSSVHSSFQRRGSFPASAGTGAPDRSVPAPDKPTFSTTTDFWSWAAALPRLLLATGTAFARFLAGTLHLFRDDSLHSTALFPLPAPRPGCFDKDVHEHGTARRQLLLDRVLHVTVAALNFLHANFRPVPSHCLQKPPSLCQAAVFDRLELLIRACSRSTGRAGSVPLCAGRRGTHLVARLTELSAHLSQIGLDGSLYPGSAHLGHVNHHDHGPPSLKPYRDSDAELPYPGSSCDTKETVMPLIRLWDTKGLLRIVPGPLPPRALCRTFWCLQK